VWPKPRQLVATDMVTETYVGQALGICAGLCVDASSPTTAATATFMLPGLPTRAYYASSPTGMSTDACLETCYIAFISRQSGQASDYLSLGDLLQCTPNSGATLLIILRGATL